MRYFFSDCELDTDRRELRVAGAEVSIEPQVFDVLAMLTANAERMLTKEELLDGVWGDRFVSESALSGRIKAARRAVGDNGRDQRVIQTVHGRGFKMIVGVSSGESGHDREPADVAAAVATPAAERTNLPRRRIDLVGRQDEAQKVLEVVPNADLVTIVGPGGAGKTSLAADVAHRLVPSHPGGVWMCELAPIGPDQVASAVLGAIDRSAGLEAAKARDITDRLAGGKAVLVLDNCEHVIDAAAQLAEELIDLSPTLTILATSREALDIRGEQVIRVSGLSYSSTRSPAVDLFLQRAAEAGEAIDDEETRTIVRDIADRLEGLPLAIELAVPRLVSRTPAELLAALDDQMSLLGSRRRHDGRQSAMDRAIAWSYELLEPEEQGLLAELSAFVAPFTAEAAQAIASGPSIDHSLHRLVEQSMVSRVQAQHGSRYRLLEPIRQFVAQKVDADRSSDLADHHATYFASRVMKLAAQLRTDNEPQAADLLTLEWPDIARAIARGTETGRAEIAIDPLLAVGEHLFWQQRTEGFAWLAQAAATIDSLDERQHDIDALCGLGAYARGDLAGARVLLDAAVANGGETVFTGFLSNYLAMNANDFHNLVVRTDRTWELALDAPDPTSIGPAAAWRLIGRVMANPDDPELPEIVAILDEQIEDAEWPTMLCFGLLSHVTRAVRLGDAPLAIRLRDELDRVTRDCSAPWFSQIGGAVTSRMADQADDPIAQLVAANQSMRAVVGAKEQAHYPLVFRAVVLALIRTKQLVAAVQIVGLVNSLPPISEVQAVLVAGYEGEVEALDSLVETEEFARLELIGRRLPVEQAADIVAASLEVAEGQRDRSNNPPE